MPRAFEFLERRTLMAAGHLDESFSGGIVRDNVSDTAGIADIVGDIAVDPQGRVVALGGILGDAEYGAVLVRCRADGSVDTTFGGGDGKVAVNPNSEMSDAAHAVRMQSDGKILVAGQYSYFDTA